MQGDFQKKKEKSGKKGLIYSKSAALAQAALLPRTTGQLRLLSLLEKTIWPRPCRIH